MMARMLRRAERAAIKERRLLCCRRTLRYGEHVRIVELRFKNMGSMDPMGLSYGKIARRLWIRPRTVQSVCRSYIQRGGKLRGPNEHWRRGQLKLSAAAIRWATSTQTLLRQAPLSLEARCAEIRDRFGENARIDPTTLRNYYRQAKIRFRQPLSNLDTVLTDDQLRERRITFLEHLMQRMRVGQRIWYMDESVSKSDYQSL